MRIVAGRHRGRSLVVPTGTTTRPTSDRTRQALFNILEHGGVAASGSAIVGARIFDGFAGTGALALEALSRGADHATLFEQDRSALACLRQNVTALGETDRCTIVSGDILRPPLAGAACRLGFLDPPYGRGLLAPALTALAGGGWLEENALVVVEIAASETFIPPLGYSTVDRRVYGAAQILFLLWQSHSRLKSL